MGKYFALVTVFAVPMAIICFYPLVMSKFGDISFGTAYTAVLGFFLLGCANLAIGVFISSRKPGYCGGTDICSFVCFLYDEWHFFIFLRRISVNLHYFRASDSGCIYYYLQHDKELCNLSAGLCDREIILAAVYMINSSFFAGGIQKVLQIFNLSGHFDNFANGIFDINGIVYYLSVIAVCVFLTVQSIVKRRWN